MHPGREIERMNMVKSNKAILDIITFILINSMRTRVFVHMHKCIHNLCLYTKIRKHIRVSPQFHKISFSFTIRFKEKGTKVNFKRPAQNGVKSI